MTSASALEQRILILAPRGRDAELICEVLGREHFACLALPGLPALLDAMGEGAGAAIIADEAIDGEGLALLEEHLARQPPWSDFPLMLLVSRPIGRAVARARSQLADLGNVILLERPLNVETLRSAAASALRGRQRQYQARNMLAEREHAAETLELRIEERTRALAQANDRLTKEIMERERALQAVTQMQKMEAVGRLTGGIAHDFNNLLNVVQGNMDLILMMSGDELVRKRAEVALNACRRGAKLTSQLLAFSRNQSLDLRPVPVSALFSGVRELVATSAGPSVQLDFEIAAGIEAVLADTNQIEMALLNLAINACDAMPDGGSLRFSASRGTPPAGLPPGDYVCLAVADSGEGMSQETAARVFEPFFTTKQVGKGTGLGLSQVYGMAQQSGGAACIRSAEGRGTTVEIWLRAARAPKLEAGPLRIDRAPQANTGARILVVEDDDVVRSSVVESLQALGHRVTQAADGPAALMQVERERPDLLITDYLMPGMTGVELMGKVRALHPQLPMIIATGYADMRAIEAVIADDVLLRKPFQLAELASSVEHALARTARPA